MVARQTAAPYSFYFIWRNLFYELIMLNNKHALLLINVYLSPHLYFYWNFWKYFMGEKVLIVGSGGLGCELIKILAQDASNSITLVDEDTIDSTNLNRQFLFTEADVGQSKSEIVARKIGTMMSTKVEFIFGKIDKFCQIDFYRQFDVVYSCLDNNEARSFVNQRCYLSGTLLIDGGSGGWLGQSFINAGECFDCLPRTQEKVYPVCTIRQMPKNFEHCLVWAESIVSEKDTKTLQEELEQHNAHIRDDGNSTINLKIDNRNIDGPSMSEINTENMSNNSNVRDDLSNKRPKTSDKLESIIQSYGMRMSSSENVAVLIHEIACIKSRRFDIAPFSFIDSQTFIEKIIPSICTTNSIIASLMILGRRNRKNYFLVQGTLNILETSLVPRKSNCLTCSLPTYQCKYISGSKISEFLASFKGDSVLDGNALYSKHSEDVLDLLEGKILLTSKNGFNYRVYFLRGANFEIVRIK